VSEWVELRKRPDDAKGKRDKKKTKQKKKEGTKETGHFQKSRQLGELLAEHSAVAEDIQGGSENKRGDE